MGEFGLDNPLQLSPIHTDLFEQRPNNALPFRNEGLEQVHRRHLGIPPLAGEFHGGLNGFLGLDRELIEAKCHVSPPVVDLWKASGGRSAAGGPAPDERVRIRGCLNRPS